MRNSFYTIIAIAFLNMSCKKNIKNEAKRNYMVLSGHVLNTNADSISFMINGNYMYHKKRFEKKIPLSKDGDFRDTIFEAVQPGWYYLNEGKNYINLHIQPGHDLQITYDASNFPESGSITGKGSEISSYFLSKKRLLDSIKNSQKNERDAIFRNIDSFKENSLKIKEASIKNLESNKSLSKQYIESELRNINYAHLSRLSYRYNAGIREGNLDATAFPSLFKSIDTLSLTNKKDFMFSEAYVSLIKDVYEIKARHLVANDSTLSLSIETLKQVATNPVKEIRNNLIYIIGVNDKLEFTEDLNWLYDAVADAHTERFSSLYKDLGETYPELHKGMPSPEFLNYYNHSGGKASLGDFRGKHVFIDVWATWCFPCRAEIPFVKKLEKDYRGKNIAFVSISIDDEKSFEKWKSLVKELDLKGVQLYANGKDYDAEFIKQYKIKSIPRFILIDPEGNIVSADAPRPSDKKLIQMLNQLNL